MSIVIIALCLYCFLEALDSIRNMGHGFECFCHKLKYVSALGVSVYLIYSAVVETVGWEELFMILSISLFIWPRTVYRLRVWYEDIWVLE